MSKNNAVSKDSGKRWYKRDRLVAAKPSSRRIQRTSSIDSDSSSSSSSSSSTTSNSRQVQRNQKEPKKKGFDWSFNKSLKEYSIAGDDEYPSFSMPSKLYEMLYDFQKDGVVWMAGLHTGKIGGMHFFCFFFAYNFYVCVIKISVVISLNHLTSF
jgi:hypothetical protein